MANVLNFRKNIFFTLLLAGIAVGLAACAGGTGPQNEPPIDQREAAFHHPAFCTDVDGTNQTVELKVVDSKVVGRPDDVDVNVDAGDQVVWVWIGDPLLEFTVKLKWDRRNDPRSQLPEPGPPNPFIRSYGSIPGPAEGWTSSQGEVCSGTAKPPAKGHTYKFTVTVINRPDIAPLDPHTRFH